MSAIRDTVHSDSTGLQIRLNRYAEFDRINGPYLDWQLEQFRPFIGDRILEIGCGIGGILERLPRCSLIRSLDTFDATVAGCSRPSSHKRRSKSAACIISTCWGPWAGGFIIDCSGKHCTVRHSIGS